MTLNILCGLPGHQQQPASFETWIRRDIVGTDVLEIEDVQGRKRVAPPPTDQTRGPKWSIFWRGITCGILLRGIEAIFKFRPTSGDTGV